MHVAHLRAAHDLSAFTCGVQALDDWLRSHALENERRDLSRTFVLVDDTGRVVGYYSLAMAGVGREHLPARFGRGLPPVEIGIVLLGRLAVDVRSQRQGYGRDLLVDAIGQAVLAGGHAAARFLAVDPIDDKARRFYTAFGFRSIEKDRGRRMFIRLDEARDAFLRS